MTVVVSNAEQLSKVKPTDSIVFLRDGMAHVMSSELARVGRYTFEEYAVECGWIPQQAPLPEVQPKPTLLAWVKRWLNG